MDKRSQKSLIRKTQHFKEKQRTIVPSCHSLKQWHKIFWSPIIASVVPQWFSSKPWMFIPRYGDLHRCLNSSWYLYKKERKSSAVVQENSQQKQIILDFHVLTIYPFWMGYLYIHIYIYYIISWHGDIDVWFETAKITRKCLVHSKKAPGGLQKPAPTSS